MTTGKRESEERKGARRPEFGSVWTRSSSRDSKEVNSLKIKRKKERRNSKSEENKDNCPLSRAKDDSGDETQSPRSAFNSIGIPKSYF